jgi:hypothetical protein
MAEDRFKLNINAFDEGRAYENLHRMINRLSLSIVVAALIVGAAMLMQVDTEYTLFGYPGLAIILFLSAFAFGSRSGDQHLHRQDAAQPVLSWRLHTCNADAKRKRPPEVDGTARARWTLSDCDEGWRIVPRASIGAHLAKPGHESVLAGLFRPENASGAVG